MSQSSRAAPNEIGPSVTLNHGAESSTGRESPQGSEKGFGATIRNEL